MAARSPALLARAAARLRPRWPWLPQQAPALPPAPAPAPGSWAYVQPQVVRSKSRSLALDTSWEQAYLDPPAGQSASSDLQAVGPTIAQAFSPGTLSCSSRCHRHYAQRSSLLVPGDTHGPAPALPSSRLRAFYSVSEQNQLHTGPPVFRRELANAAAALPEALSETEDKFGVAQRDRNQEGVVVEPNLAGRRSLFRSEQSLASDWRGQRQRPRVEAPRVMPQEESNSLMSSAALEYYIPVKAFYIARSLDFKGLIEGPYKGFRSHVVRNNVIIRFPDRSSHPASGNTGMEAVPHLSERYVVALEYGSLVFLNFSAAEQQQVLDEVQPFCDTQFQEARKDDYGIVLRPSLSGWSEGGHDHIMVKALDINNIRVISSVLGQSVALEFYAKKVDEMVNTFSELNRGMEATGTFTMKRKKLFQLVAAANTTLADVILRLGLLERSDTAWKHAHYAKIWEYLRDDFEMDERFESLDFKLNIIQHNVRFFLDILQNRKSDTLEWIIILLIAGEICVSLYEIIHTAMKSGAVQPYPSELDSPLS